VRHLRHLRADDPDDAGERAGVEGAEGDRAVVPGGEPLSDAVDAEAHGFFFAGEERRRMVAQRAQAEREPGSGVGGASGRIVYIARAS
jgi:hypothetical protein